MNGWQSLLDSETVKSRISCANKLHKDGIQFLVLVYYCSYQNVLANSSHLISEQVTRHCLYYCVPIPRYVPISTNVVFCL